MKKMALLSLLPILFLSMAIVACNGSEDLTLSPTPSEEEPTSFLTSSEQENAILDLVLHREASYYEGLSVVAPQTLVFDYSAKEVQDRLYQREPTLQSDDIRELVVAAYEHNQEPVRLSLKPSPEEDYIVLDYAGECGSKYFDDCGGGWNRWQKQYPEARTYIRVSRPAYNPKNGQVLVYVTAETYFPVGGSGEVILYSYESGQIEELYSILLFSWIT